MTQILTPTDRYLADFERLQSATSGQPAWLRDLRRRAFERFQELGFPTARRGNEAWKYTNIGPIAEGQFEYSPDEGLFVDPEIARAIGPWEDAWTSFAFVDGARANMASSPPIARQGDGLLVTGLAQAITSGKTEVERHIARYATFEDEAFTALNTAFLDDGVLIHVAANGQGFSPIHLIHVSTTGVVSYPRTLIVTERNSRVTVIESYVSLGDGRSFTNAVTEVVAGDGAQVDHCRLLLENDETFHVGNTRVYQGKDSRFSSMSFAAGAAIGRNDFRVLLDAPGAECSLNGLYITSGTQHIDNSMNIEHAKPHTTSRLYYKGILDGKSRAVFGGLVLVRPGADKTDSYQQDKNLVLSDEAEVDSKPSLEIYADDVKCGHGATAGAVAEDAIFYMRSRGLDEQTANLLLVRGFASEILDTVAIEPLRARLERLTMEALPRFNMGVGS